ncbi:MAG: 16S rRNA (adenine(1518)-N(6)/adenine(1519)-N(6))-dimethyltransferase RsmA [Desulfobacteraceae bacterium]|nr:ribosomal RNA small subunit methyltransferase A [Pseudomonadota bacterium]MBU4258827.1 ribosomal RNA small subunit methyltransferase A [Pseudomonadota bacterium]MCG2759429.1 16S rRNA (adenine(1518)-N(6)/adenine(1519)-N(6))-dimethyltransferase RsmA [Desulfobacteraceae bacterium]
MTSPRTLLAAWRMHAKKQLGQHFLENLSTSEMIVSSCKIAPEDIVLEIGAGLGALTIPVARIAKKVYAVEKDHKIISLLKTELTSNSLFNVVLIEKDILRVNIEEFAEEANRKILALGNLPYNISSQILIKLIKARSAVSRAVLMFQKELSQRITAQPGCKEYGRLTVMLNYCADIKKVADVKASQFFPRPKVDSEVLEITFKDSLKYSDDEEFLYRVIKAAFGQRRKNLKNALAGSELHIAAETSMHALENAGIDPTRRAETLSVEEFVRLSNILKVKG